MVVVGLGPPSGADGKRTVLGGALWEYFKASQCFLYTYLVITSAGRGKGLGRLLANGQWKAVRNREKVRHPLLKQARRGYVSVPTV